MKRFVLSAVAAVTLAAAFPAAAQFQKPEDAVKYRKAAFTVMAAHFGRLGAMANGRMPFDAKAAAANADVVSAVAGLPWAAFGDGTGVGDTRAKAEIWTDADKFKGGGQKMVEEIGKLNAAAKSGSLDQLKAAFGETAKTCKGCHDNFRKE
jgi:cytochrome c556